MTISIWQADDRQPIRDVDFLIVGAGLVGCAAAYYANQAGREVFVTDQSSVAMGASGRNAGFMITGLDTYYHKAVARYGAAVTQEMWALSQRTIRFWKNRIAQSAGAVQYAESGSLLLAETPAEAQDLQQAAQALDAAGIATVYHAQDPLGRGYYAAIEQPDDAAVQPYQLARAVLQQSGAHCTGNNAVYHIEQDHSDYVTVYTQQWVLRARRVLLCTNAFSPQIDPYFVGKVIPTRAQCMVTEPLPESVLTTCGYSNYGYMYYRSTFDGRLLIGGGRQHAKAEENDTTEDKLNPRVQQALDAYKQKHFPDVTAPIARRWSGIMGFSVDGLPLVGALPHMPRVGFAVGFTGHGLAMGAECAERAVELLLRDTHAGAVDARRLA